jgi:hypothetical protein
MLQVHERASGGLNNWGKTYGLRVGSLAGSTILPPNWNPRHVDFKEDPIRYLLLPTFPPIVHRRFDEWSALGVGTTYAGRNLIVKNSVLAMVWYAEEAQTIDPIDTTSSPYGKGWLGDS